MVRRFLVAAFALSLWGCVAYEPVVVQASPEQRFDRSWQAAAGAFVDQGVAITAQNYRTGTIRGDRGGIAITASVRTLPDGRIEVKFRPVSGRDDQAGGIVWRWKDKDNYYVARANALENNVSLYYTARGIRKTLKYVDAPVSAGHWHTLRVDFAGTAISVSLDGKRYIDFADDHIAGSGAVGVWTKADSVTAFSEFAYHAARQ